MGLAAPKKKTKLSHDPNNTRWINDTQSFGHKILTSQGWKKGEFLGAKNAAHAEFHTAANSSHIRVTHKDDNLGLGAKLGTGVGHGECTGLDAFKDLLGRLNGKSQTQIAQEQKVRVDIRRAIYTEKRWGSINFVSGGYLVGDKIQNLIDMQTKKKRELPGRDNTLSKDLAKHQSKSNPKVEEYGILKKLKKSKKRKANPINEDDTDNVDSTHLQEQVKIQDTKDPNKLSSLSKMDNIKAKKTSKSKTTNDVDHNDIKKKEEQKKKKRKRESSGSVVKKVDKLSREERKFQRRKIHLDVQTFSDTSLSPPKKSMEIPTLPNEKPKDTNSILLRGRHAIRAKNIAQKKLSGMDMASLNQIFMIKT